MTERDEESVWENIQDYIEGRLETGSEDLEALNQRTERAIAELEALRGRPEAPPDLEQRLERLRNRA